MYFFLKKTVLFLLWKKFLEKSSLKNIVAQYNSWHMGAGTHICIFESSQLESSYGGDLLNTINSRWHCYFSTPNFFLFLHHQLILPQWSQLSPISILPPLVSGEKSARSAKALLNILYSAKQHIDFLVSCGSVSLFLLISDHQPLDQHLSTTLSAPFRRLISAYQLLN